MILNIFIALLIVVFFVLLILAVMPTKKKQVTHNDQTDDEVVVFSHNKLRVKTEKQILLEEFKKHTPSSNIPMKSTYYKIGNGDYYVVVKCFGIGYKGVGYLNAWGLIRFKDGEYESLGEHTIHLVEGKDIVECEDPKKEHWKHFLHLEMLAKKERQQRCHSFVDRILAKQVEYNDLQLQYEMIPTAPIVDILTFKNFCSMVKEDVEFEDFEIQNYLLTKQSKC